MEDDQRSAKEWRRFGSLKVDRKQVRTRARKIETATLKHVHKFLTRRWTNIRDVGRNTVGWLLLVGVMIVLTLFQSFWRQNLYSISATQQGGTYAEGVVGRLETMNPLFASTVAENSAVRLLFSSLLSYDADNQLKGDAAELWAVSEDGKMYTIKLRQDIKWHDGQPLTSDDVLFTVGLMQNTATRAAQYGTWAGVKAEKVDKWTVRFILPSLYAPFAHSLTFGILPKHILKDIDPAELRENQFGRRPIGSGPFKFKRLQIIDPSKDRLVVHMEANDEYYVDRPVVNRFQLHTYENSEALRLAFVTDEINAALGLNSAEIKRVLARDSSNRAANITISNGVYALMNNESPLLKDVELRKALLLATNREALKKALNDRAVSLEGPLLNEHTGDSQLKQAAFSAKTAAEKLDSLGWKLEGKTRIKEGKKLSFVMVAPSTGDYKTIVETLASQWRAIGAEVKTTLVKPDDITTQYLQPRAYDVLVYELAIGANPDVFAYWGSTQAKATGLNFANYRSGLADDALSSARARLAPNLRQAKYRTFAEQWLKDTPAIALYQPLFSYVSSSAVSSLNDMTPVADASVRYRDAIRWGVVTGPAMQTP